MNHPVERRQSALALLHERRADNPSISIAAVAAEAGVSRETLRDWSANEERIMGVRQSTVLYVRREVAPNEKRVIAWISSLQSQPTVGQVCDHVAANEPALFADKSFSAKRAYAQRLIRRADTENLGFARVRANEYGNKPIPKRSRKTPCSCKRNCGSSCKNRLANRECSSRTCAIPTCQNRAMQTADRTGVVPMLRRVHTPGRGEGIVADQPIKKGAFVREYVGRIIEARHHEALESSGRAGYLMQLTKDLYIDALPAGNESRLINHSCRANCASKLFYVNDVPRVGIFAARNVRAGEELTISYGSDYRFAHSCLCEHCNSEQ